MVRAKFKLIGVEFVQMWIKGQMVDARNFKFQPSKDEVFGEATPSAQLQMTIVPKEAWEQFELGKEYYVDFTDVETSK